jgi:ABC-type glycerol-3-phosphate transport system substrate-binding protein
MKQKISRRGFCKIAGAGLMAAAAGPTIWVRNAPAQRKTVTMLFNSHFVPQFDQELQRQVSEWGQARGVDARVDLIREQDLGVKLASEAEARTGHDIVVMRWMEAAVHQISLAPMDDVVQDLERSLGAYPETARYLWNIRGQWVSLPYRYDSGVATINTEHWGRIGLDADAVGNLTWNQFAEAAAKLQANNTPVGVAISEAFDSVHFCYVLLWSHGAKAVDAKGNITINSPETAAAIEMAKRIYKFMPQDVLAWDEASNNRALMAGTCAWSINPPSIWAVSKRDKLPVADKLDHVAIPAGPAGRFRTASCYSLGIWNFSPNIDASKDLLRFLMQKDNFIKQVEASGGYNQAFLPGHRGAPIYQRERALRHYEPPKETVQAWGWPAPVSPATGISITLFILPTMFAKAVSGELTTEKSMAWAERQLTRIYRG